MERIALLIVLESVNIYARFTGQNQPSLRSGCAAGEAPAVQNDPIPHARPQVTSGHKILFLKMFYFPIFFPQFSCISDKSTSCFHLEKANHLQIVKNSDVRGQRVRMSPPEFWTHDPFSLTLRDVKKPQQPHCSVAQSVCQAASVGHSGNAPRVIWDDGTSTLVLGWMLWSEPGCTTL